MHVSPPGESVDRERKWNLARQAPDADKLVNYIGHAHEPLAEGPVSGVSVENGAAPAGDVVAAPDTSIPIAEARTSSGGGNKAAVAFVRDALAQGPISAREIERRAVSAGLLEEGKPIGKSKVFRTARAALGAKSYQQPGQRARGWIWSWDQAPVPPATQSGPDAG